MNTEGKKIHCLPDPERVLNSQSQVEAKYRQNFDKWVSNVNEMRNFDAATVISSLAMRDQESDVKTEENGAETGQISGGTTKYDSGVQDAP